MFTILLSHWWVWGRVSLMHNLCLVVAVVFNLETWSRPDEKQGRKQRRVPGNDDRGREGTVKKSGKARLPSRGKPWPMYGSKQSRSRAAASNVPILTAAVPRSWSCHLKASHRCLRRNLWLIHDQRKTSRRRFWIQVTNTKRKPQHCKNKVLRDLLSSVWLAMSGRLFSRRRTIEVNTPSERVWTLNFNRS